MFIDKGFVMFGLRLRGQNLVLRLRGMYDCKKKGENEKGLQYQQPLIYIINENLSHI